MVNPLATSAGVAYGRGMRRYRGVLMAVVLGASVPISPPVAAAEESAPLQEAKSLFRRGLALLEAGNTEGALESFVRSREVVPSVQNTVNAAICLERLGRYDEALEMYDDVVARFAGDLGEQDRKSLGPLMADLRQRVGYLQLAANVDGAVVIDGRARASLPLRVPLRVLAGKRSLRIAKEGFRAYERSVDIASSETVEIEARLEPLSPVTALAEPTTAAPPVVDLGPAPAAGWARPALFAGGALAVGSAVTIVVATLALSHERDVLALNCVQRDGDDCPRAKPGTVPATQTAVNNIATFRTVRWIGVGGALLGVTAATLGVLNLVGSSQPGAGSARFGVGLSREAIVAHWEAPF